MDINEILKIYNNMVDDYIICDKSDQLKLERIKKLKKIDANKKKKRQTKSNKRPE